MNSQRCPQCDEPIASDAINITEGVALCAACGQLSKLSKLRFRRRTIRQVIEERPPGCLIHSDGKKVRIQVSQRSIHSFLMLAGITLFWNGIVFLFVLIAIAGLIVNLGGALPDWFPATGVKNGAPQVNGHRMELGETLFLCVFLFPFALVGTGLLLATLYAMDGKTEIVIDEENSFIAHRWLGIILWKRSFDPRQVDEIELADTTWKTDGVPNRILKLSANRTIKFGSLLSENQLTWLQLVLQEIFFGFDSTATCDLVSRPHWLSLESVNR